MEQENNSKRLAKNTAYMYVRMILLTLITLYTSRVILQQLGVEDYGIYNVVGSIVLMFNSLRSVFASSTQRYYSYEMGKGNRESLTNIFNASVQLNLVVAAIFFVLVEVIGLWFINCHMNVDPNKMTAANYVLQFSIVGAVVSIFTTSFDAVIIANEKMDFYAGISILEAVLKLIICYLISLVSEKLIFYSFLMFMTILLVLFCNYLYCKASFKEVVFRKVKDKTMIREMSKFAGWNFFGNSAFALSQNGLNMVLNVFGGPVVNAARGIAYQVNQIILQVINNIAIVMKPFTIKKYAEGDMEYTMKVTYFTSKIYFVVQLVIVILFSFFIREIIYLWLGQIPEFVESFLVILLWYSLVRSLHGPLDILYFANGDIKKYQLTEGILLVLPVVLAYILLYLGYPYYAAFLSQLVIEIINFVAILYIASKECQLNIKGYQREVILPCMLLGGLYAASFFAMHYYEINNLLLKTFFASTLIATILLFAYYIGLNAGEKSILKTLIIARKRNNEENY